jgi:predicted AAA+ superfamily ATPase
VVFRDAELIDSARDPLKLRRYLQAVALNTAGVVAAKSLYEAADVNSRTAQAYDRLLGNLLLVNAVPAWWTNRLKRLAKAPKRYLVDPGIAGAILEVDRAGLRRNGDLMGRMLDTFAASQLRAEARLSESRPSLYHLRTSDQHREIDLLAEYRDGTVFGFEFKSSGTVSTKDARHLSWLRDELGDKFIGGAVLHTGPRSFELGDRLVATPIATLWTRPQTPTAAAV